ncbi:MAG TPA: right-handed parallel beta-helix repeat-containing protein [Candidatus Babeliales bacterium]|jgi:parallel beta-helix repeat protein|nr:right-handed parallel beta-helix repeat-containing protein [Candidatus Babeliales bacterium]
MNQFGNKAFLLLFLTPLAYATNINQADLPYTITEPGQYYVQENLVYTGSDNAITIKANNVLLNFNGFSLHLSHHEATGVLVKKSSEFTIIGDVISNTSSKTQKGNGIYILKSKNGSIENVFTRHNQHGLKIKKSKYILVEDGDFAHAQHSDALVQESVTIGFDNCTFTDGHHGLTLIGANRDCSVTNSAFPSAKFANLNVLQVDGMMVDKCSFTNTGGGDDTKPNLVQFGGAEPEQACFNVTFRNCTISNPCDCNSTSPEGLGLYQGSGFLVDSCVIEINNTNQDPAADLSGIHISNPGLGINGTIASNVIIRNCLIQGPATDGLYPDVGSSNILIENCLVTGASKDGIFLAGTSACTVTNNTVVGNATNGIFLGETSFSNAVTNNIVNSNGFNPIISSLPPFGNGISIASDSSNNSIQNNTVFSNTTDGINDQGTNNQIFYNTAYANVTNYVAATDTIIESAPGVATLVGANISA